MNSRINILKYSFLMVSLIFCVGCTKNTDEEDIIEENLPPEEFDLKLPENGAGPCSGVGPGFSQTFSWDSAKDPEDQEIRYTLKLGTTENPTTIVASGILETSFTVPESELNPGQQYYWKVEAVDTVGNSTESEIFTFFAATLC